MRSNLRDRRAAPCQAFEGAPGAILEIDREFAPALHRISNGRLAAGFFNIPPHHNHQLSLKLTELGKRLLHHGARLPVMVTVTSVSPTGRSKQHSYSELLTRR